VLKVGEVFVLMVMFCVVVEEEKGGARRKCGEILRKRSASAAGRSHTAQVA
jgi:hypothetical protein